MPGMKEIEVKCLVIASAHSVVLFSQRDCSHTNQEQLNLNENAILLIKHVKCCKKYTKEVLARQSRYLDQNTTIQNKQLIELQCHLLTSI